MFDWTLDLDTRYKLTVSLETGQAKVWYFIQYSIDVTHVAQ